MSEQIREQVSAFLDGELSNAEAELLLKRLTRDGELRENFGRYALIGETLRGGGGAHLSKGFHARVNHAIDGVPAAEVHVSPRATRLMRWWQPLAGAAVAAGVAVVAVFALQQRAVAPGIISAVPREALSYTVPAVVSESPTVVPAARLTSYVFAHSQYSSGLGQSNVLSGLLTESEDQEAARQRIEGARDVAR